MSTGLANRSTLPMTENRFGSSMPVEPRLSGSRRFESEDGLIKMLNEHIILERGLERAKEVLIQNQDFNLFDAFRIFDIDGVGSITAKEFFYGLADIGVHA